jgi:hypothetical protein
MAAIEALEFDVLKKCPTSSWARSSARKAKARNPYKDISYSSSSFSGGGFNSALIGES